MDDLEKAILLSYEPGGGVDPALRSQAIAYCQQMKGSPSICRLCVERLARTDLVPVQFWCLQAIHDALRLRYPSMDPADRALLRDFLLSVACLGGDGGAAASAAPRVAGGPAFIRNKFAQALVALVCFEYPAVWSTAFLDLLPHLSKGAAVIDMFSRVLNMLDDEVISMDYPRSAEEIAVAGRIKDAMRAQCIPQIVRAWFDIVSLYRRSDPGLAATVLDTMSRYIAWIDISLVANDAFMPLLFDLVLTEGLHEQLRAAAAKCLLAVVSKRMDPKQKLALLQSLRISRVFGLVAEQGEAELVSRLAALITGYAAEALDCFKRLSSGNVGAVAMELLEEALPSVLYVIENCEVDSAFNAVQFLSDYVFTMKSPSQKQVVYLGQILEVIRGQICYDPVYRDNLELPDKIGKEEEDQMSECRKDFFTLLRSICQVAPEVTQLFIRNLLANALASSEMNVEQAEVALSLFYRLGESISDEGMRIGTGLLKEMVPMLLSARFPCHSHRMVALVYLETVTRYMKFVQENTQYVPLALAAFLDQRGIHHPNVNVSRRASYLFMRAVKLLKSSLVPFIETILQSLQDIVAKFTSIGWPSKDPKCSGFEDGTYMFEAIGLLIGMEDVSQEKQSEYLLALLTPLCHQVESLLVDSSTHTQDESFSKAVRIQQAIMAINALSKGFSERLVTASRPAIGAMFKKTLDVLLQIFVVFPNVEPIRNKITSFLHRMVEILGPSVFPYLPLALEKLLAESEPKEMVEFLLLINQLICKFNTAVVGILEDIFPAMASRLFCFLPKETFPSGPGSNTEEIRELQELQKTLFTFLHVVATHDLSSILLAPKSQAYLDVIIQLLLFASCSHKDMIVRKTCVQILVRFTKDWCDKVENRDKVSGFRKFIIETFATNCCLYSVLDKSFDLRDANTALLFGEIMLAQKVMYEKFGDAFLHHFVAVAHYPPDLVEIYRQKLQGNDIKAFKPFYQFLIENLRQQQNGIFIFS
uniref:Exportin-T n=1 Tax=Anthurium amnicola TaxID=1678845 RepID=A0A1D1YNA1_9ARAE